jgi:uncharacterized protein (TIGR03663 family)
VLIALLAFVAALLVRLPGLESRPFHTDEAVNAFIVEETLSADGYRYRLNDHHGPTLFYLTSSVLRIGGISHVAGMEAWMLRLVAAVSGAALVAAVFLLRPALGTGATVGSAVFLGAGAPFVYYSGIFIHETLLVLLLLGFIAVFWRWRQNGGIGLAILGGVLAGLMLATKETAAPILLLFLPVFLIGSPLAWRHRLAGMGVAVIALVTVVFLFFSRFGLEPARALDLIAAVHQHVGRGLGNEHAHPWWTYLSWAGAPTRIGLPWSGCLIAGFASFGLWRGRAHPILRRLALWGLLLVVFHSALPYKTPWLMLAPLLPLALLAGCGVAALWQTLPSRKVAVATVLLVTVLLGAETYARCHRHAVNAANPLAYAPSSPDLDRLQTDIEAFASNSPRGREILVQVFAKNYWPLPWTLRRFPRTGYWPEPPADLQPGLVLAGPEAINRVPFGAPPETYELRPGVFIFLTQLSTNPDHTPLRP